MHMQLSTINTGPSQHMTDLIYLIDIIAADIATLLARR